MNWDALTISMVSASVVGTASFFASAVYFAVKKRQHRFGRTMAFIMVCSGILSIFINPITNMFLGLALDEYQENSLRAACEGKPVRVLYARMGPPDSAWTNERGVYVSYRNTSPFFSIYQQDILVFMSNDTVVSVLTTD